jgi:hypothetical protein
MIAAIIGASLIFSLGLFAGLWLGALLDQSRNPEPDEHCEAEGCGQSPAGRRRAVTAWADDFLLMEK